MRFSCRAVAAWQSAAFEWDCVYAVAFNPPLINRLRRWWRTNSMLWHIHRPYIIRTCSLPSISDVVVAYIVGVLCHSAICYISFSSLGLSRKERRIISRSSCPSFLLYFLYIFFSSYSVYFYFYFLSNRSFFFSCHPCARWHRRRAEQLEGHVSILRLFINLAEGSSAKEEEEEDVPCLCGFPN